MQPNTWRTHTHTVTYELKQIYVYMEVYVLQTRNWKYLAIYLCLYLCMYVCLALPIIATLKWIVCGTSALNRVLQPKYAALFSQHFKLK